MKKVNLLVACQIFQEYLKGNGYHEKTIYCYMKSLKRFKQFLKRKKKYTEDVRDVTEKDLKEYIKYLRTTKSERKKEPLSEETIIQYFDVVKQLFKSLYLSELILINPAVGIEIKREGRKRKRVMLSQEEMAKLLDGIETRTATGQRDRALFELMYSSGLRISEVAKLEIRDIDFEKRMMLIRESKFSKDRIVPISEVAMRFLKMYLENTKKKEEKDYVFHGEKGHLSHCCINSHFKEYAKNTGIKRKRLGSHTIRHSIATHLLENGANIRYVQELLGHESIETTVSYTQGVVESLKRIYKRYHPRENDYYDDVSDEYLERLKKFKEDIMFWGKLWKKNKKKKRKGFDKTG